MRLFLVTISMASVVGCASTPQTRTPAAEAPAAVAPVYPTEDFGKVEHHLSARARAYAFPEVRKLETRYYQILLLGSGGSDRLGLDAHPYFKLELGQSSCDKVRCRVAISFTPDKNAQPGVYSATLTAGKRRLELEATVVAPTPKKK